MKPKVINIKQAPAGWKHNREYVYIGRPGYFGNPIDSNGRWGCTICGRLHFGSGSTLICYEKYLRAKVENGLRDQLKHPGVNTVSTEFVDKLKALSGKTLVCFCKPNPCHGDILATVCEELNK